VASARILPLRQGSTVIPGGITTALLFGFAGGGSLSTTLYTLFSYYHTVLHRPQNGTSQVLRLMLMIDLNSVVAFLQDFDDDNMATRPLGALVVVVVVVLSCH
jgi:hypothetical protein